MKFIKSTLLPLLLLLCTFARADALASLPGENLFATLSTRGIASSLQSKDLTVAWRVLRVNSASEESLFLQMMTQQPNAPKTENDFYYTRGDVISLAGQAYLVAYRVLPAASAEERNRQQQYLRAWRDDNGDALETQAPPLEESAVLSLSLIALGQGMSLTDIKAFDPENDLVTTAAKAKRKVKIDRSISQSNLKQISLGFLQYTQDYDEKFPPMRGARRAEEFTTIRVWSAATAPVQLLVGPYVKNTQIFLHPGTGRPYLPNYKISRRSLAEIQNPAATILFYEDAPDAEGKRNIAFVDGHVKAFDEATFQKMRIAQGISESGWPAAMSPQQAAASGRAAEAARRATAAKNRNAPPEPPPAPPPAPPPP